MIIPFISICLAFHLGESFSNVQTNLIIKISVIDLFFRNNLSHLAGIASSFEIDENNNSIHRQNQTDTKSDNEVRLSCGPSNKGRSLETMT